MGRRSSIASNAIARPETIATPGVKPYLGRKITSAATKPRYMARPPSIGVGFACAWRPPGWATRPTRGERRMASGVTAAVTTRATSSGHRPASKCAVRLASASSLKKSVKGVRDRELAAQLERALVHRVERGGVVDALHQVGDAVRDHGHLRLAHAARRHQRRAHSDPAGVELG